MISDNKTIHLIYTQPLQKGIVIVIVLMINVLKELE